MEKQREGQRGEGKKEKDGHDAKEKEEQDNNRLKNDVSTSTIDIKI